MIVGGWYVRLAAMWHCYLSLCIYIYIYMNLQTAVTCLFKFADDMALVGLLLNEDSLATYFSHVSFLNEWCEESFLEINVGKTKELVLDARKTKMYFSCQGKQ